MNDLLSLTAAEAAAKIAAGKIKAQEYVSACFHQINRLEPKIHAWVQLNQKYVLEQAQVIDKKIQNGDAVGKLAGIPVGIKDIFNTFDFPTEMGSSIWKNFTPGNDARVVFRLRQEGAVIPGKTVTAEFAVHTPGPTHNPHKHGYMTGTSSSGSAAAVAAQMVPVAIGTQTAGSTIRPASYCGVFAMKTSFGLIPRTGMLKTTDTLDTVGFFSRSAADLKLMFDILRVKGENYPVSNQALLRSKNKSAKSPNWRIGLVTDSIWTWEKAESYAKTALKNFAAKLNRDNRLEVETLNLPNIFNSVHRLHQTIYNKTLAYYFQKEYRQKKLVSKIMQNLIGEGSKISLSDYQVALTEQEKIAALLDNLFKTKDLDAILTLSTGGEAMKGLDRVDRPDSCLIWSFCQVPTISLPAFRGPQNLPFGVQLVGRKYDDYRLMELAQYLENNNYASYSPPKTS
jgi:Asp-tRNA(Asn)/Glu-tRNA(Gln) amidotransferase A subunit family amidase